jgi:hypothetical protein
MHKPQLLHRQAVQHLLNYLCRHPSDGLWFPRGGGTSLTGFSDVDYNGNPDDRTSTSAYIFYFGQTPISWSSRKQSSSSRSSCESEYRALAKCTCEAIWLRRLTRELGFWDGQATTLWCDNQSAIKLTRNPLFHDKTKHFETDWHFTRQKVEDGTVRVHFIKTQDQLADILTKSLGRNKFAQCKAKLSLKTLADIASYPRLEVSSSHKLFSLP